MAIVPKKSTAVTTQPQSALERPDVVARARARLAPSTAASPVPVAEGTSPKSASSDSAVGYCKPPKHTQFPKGQSGNPKGRPKGAKGLKTLAREILTEKIEVRTPRGTKRIAKIEAMLRKAAENAFAGSHRERVALFQLYQAAVPDELPQTPAALSQGTADPVSPAEPDVHEKAIVAEFRQLILAELMQAREQEP